ncbi:MAG: histidine phosphotransferase family protein [Alphaproteobacteria bacterium]
MTPQIDMKVIELVCSRLCHDLVGPVGAVNNGIELLEDFDPSTAEDVLPLLQTSARQAWRRLDFFRLAFGAAGGRETWPMAELGRYAVGWFEGGKVILAWPDDAAVGTLEIAAVQAKLLLHLALIAGEALPRGGTVTVAPPAGGSGDLLALRAEGRGAALHPRVEAVLAGEDEDLDARSIPAHLALLLARSAGLALVVDRGTDRVSLLCRTG